MEEDEGNKRQHPAKESKIKVIHLVQQSSSSKGARQGKKQCCRRWSRNQKILTTTVYMHFSFDSCDTIYGKGRAGM